MSSEVRVHVRLGTLRLDYEGPQAFYESKVESLVAAAAAKGIPNSGGEGRPLPRTDSAHPGASAASNGAPDSGSASHGGASAATADGPAPFTPKSSEFGRYIRRLGPEASEPDRQVVALAFYLWNYERIETFGRREIEGCFKVLGLPVPDSLDAIFSDLTDRKRFLESTGAGELRLSKKGENYVKTRLLSA